VEEPAKLLVELGERCRLGLVDRQADSSVVLMPSGPHAATFWASPIPASSAVAGVAAICWMTPIR
jgi:hypothetical protein